MPAHTTSETMPRSHVMSENRLPAAPVLWTKRNWNDTEVRAWNNRTKLLGALEIALGSLVDSNPATAIAKKRERVAASRSHCCRVRRRACVPRLRFLGKADGVEHVAAAFAYVRVRLVAAKLAVVPAARALFARSGRNLSSELFADSNVTADTMKSSSNTAASNLSS